MSRAALRSKRERAEAHRVARERHHADPASPSRSSTASASRRASSSRLGGTSRASMLAETSITSTTSEPVAPRRTTSRPHSGRAAPTSSSARAPRRSATPTQRSRGRRCASSACSGRVPTSRFSARAARDGSPRHSSSKQERAARTSPREPARITRRSWQPERPGARLPTSRAPGSGRRSRAAWDRRRRTRGTRST